VTAGILLAAGQSRRFGGDKQLAEFRGKSLLARSAQLLVESDLWPRVVVLSGLDAFTEQHHREALNGLDVKIAINCEPERGMSNSIRVGLSEVAKTSNDVHGLIITVCDQVLCTSDTLRALKNVSLSSGAEIVASGYSGTIGVPAYFSQSMFAQLEQLEGDQGAGSLLRRDYDKCQVVPFEDGSVDIDTAADFVNLSAGKTRDANMTP
jgi:CTP:molybdopterin cytidylyltransferase MocA